MHRPIRTCMGCGAKRPKEELLRLFKDKDGEIRTDPKKIAGGRGVYVCDSPACMGRLSKHKQLQRAFRSEHPVTLLNGNAENTPKFLGG